MLNPTGMFFKEVDYSPQNLPRVAFGWLGLAVALFSYAVLPMF